MLAALVVGLIGSSALVLGGVVGAVWDAPTRVSGVMLAFESGGAVLASLADTLMSEAFEKGGRSTPCRPRSASCSPSSCRTSDRSGQQS